MLPFFSKPSCLSPLQARKSALQSGDLHEANLAELRIIAEMLSAQFGPVTVDEDQLSLALVTDGKSVLIDHKDAKVRTSLDKEPAGPRGHVILAGSIRPRATAWSVPALVGC